MMKKLLSMMLVLLMVCSCLMSVSAAGTTLYVSPTGDDSNPGTLSAPLATLAKACEIAENDSVIYLTEGTYKVNNTAEIKGKKNLIIRNMNGAKVTLLASNQIDGALVKKVTNQEILDRIVTKAAKENLYEVDMKSAGITEYGTIGMRGMGYPTVPNDPQLLIGGERQLLARYPDNDYLNVDEVIDPSVDPRNQEDSVLMNYKGRGITIRSNDARISKWKAANEVFMFGYFMHDWAEATLACTIDFENKNAISTEYPSYYGVTTDRRFYFFNLLEEISLPGEWYLDRESGMLYVYLNAELKGKSLEYVTFSTPFIAVADSENIKIQGINIQNGLDYGITIDGSKKVTVSDCNFNEVGGNAIVIKKSFDCLVDYCNFMNLGAGGVNIDAGDRETLTPGNCAVTNCTFKGLQRLLVNGYPAIYLQGVGNKASHNDISDMKMIAINYGGNNQIIEYNNIYDVCKDTSDTGAIYAGRNWTTRGNVIRYNYIHDMKMIDTATGMKMCAVYLDDCHSSTEVYGNVFYNIEQIALYGGGRNNTFENNIMINCSQPFRLDSRGLGWMAENDSMDTMYSTLEAMPYKEGVWAETYPELVNILDDEPGAPKYNIIRNNVQYQSAGYNIDQVALNNGTFENNIEISNKKNFVDFANKDFTLSEGSEVFTKLPEFEAIPFKEIGVQEKPAEKTADAVLAGAVVLKLDTPKTYVFGAESMIDPANSAVVPFTKDDRTLVPVRFIAESFGGEVTWDEATQKVGITTPGDFVIELQLGNKEMIVNGGIVELDVPAQAVNDRTVLPLRAVVEALGKKVFWDDRGLIVISDEEVLTAEETELVTSIVNLF